MISIYQNRTGFRVVQGTHKPADEHKKLSPRTYATAVDAYRVETDAAIRRALLMLDPTAKDAVTPNQMHHVVPAGASAGPTDLQRFIVESRGPRPETPPFYIYDRFHGTASRDYLNVSDALRECELLNKPAVQS